MNKIVALDISIRKGREGDTQPPPYRSNRFVNDGGAWYYRTREQGSIGPYKDRSKAEKSARAFVNLAQNHSGEHLNALINSHINGLNSVSKPVLPQTLRAGEWEIPEYRSSRIFQKTGQWYFNTREQEPVGPYSSHQEAEDSAKVFVDFVKAIKPRSIPGLISAMNEPEPAN